MLLSPVIGEYDLRLVAVAAWIACAAAYVMLGVLDHMSVSTRWRRAVWTGTAALTSALGIWAMQCIVTLSLCTHVLFTYDVRAQAASLGAALGFSLLGAFAIRIGGGGVRGRIASGVMFGVATIASHALGVHALQLDGHTVYRLSMFVAALVISLSSASVAILIGTRLQRANRAAYFAVRLAASVIFAVGSIAAYLYLLAGVHVSSKIPLTNAAATQLPLALAIAAGTVCILLGAFAAVMFDDHANYENRRARTLDDLYRRERHVSATLQKALLPAQLPVVPNLTFSSVYLPHSKEAYVGGDWYDAFMISDHRIAFSMGDVAGHGLSAALTMNVVRHAMRACAENDSEPHRILGRTNRILLRSDHPAIVTAVFATLDLNTLRMHYASAGHPPPLVMTPHGSMLERSYGDPPLGIVPNIAYRDHVLDVPPGGMMTFYTDGCTEFDRDLIKGERRLAEVCAEVLVRREDEPAHAIAERLFGKRAIADDAAIFCVRVEREYHRVLRAPIETVHGDEIVSVERTQGTPLL